MKIEAVRTKNEGFDQTHLNTGSKTQNVEESSLDLIIISGKISQVLVNKTPSKEFTQNWTEINQN